MFINRSWFFTRFFVALMSIIITKITALEEETTPPSVIETIAEINMKSFGWEDDEWDAHSMEEYLNTLMEHLRNPTKKKKRYRAYEFYKSFAAKQEIPSVLFDQETTWRDLTIFCGQHDRKTYIAKALDRTSTELGTVSLFNLLAQPVNDRELLIQRQTIIKALYNNAQLEQSLEALFEKLKQTENIFLSFYSPNPIKHTIKNQCHFSFKEFDFLNKNQTALLAKNLYDHQQRIGWVVGNTLAALALTGYGVFNLVASDKTPAPLASWAEDYKSSPSPFFPWLWKINNKWFKSGLAIAGGVLCGLHIKNNAQWMYECFLLEKCLHSIMQDLSCFIMATGDIYDYMINHPELLNHVELHGLKTFFEERIVHSAALQEFLEMLSSETFEEDFSLFSHKGRIVRAFGLMLELKQDFTQLAAAIGKLDAYCSLAKLIKEFENKRVQFCFADYVQATSPQLTITDVWHPLLNEATAVANSVTLVGSERPSMVVTGPNAGGKSTIIKAIMIAIIMAQTIGIAPATQMTLTPFNSIATYLNIVDDIGQGNSLFMAEVKQAQRLIDKVAQTPPGAFNVIAFDEIFNGTSFIEGSAAAYSVAHYLAQSPQTICLLATHFPLLTKLETDTDAFKNYCVEVTRTADGKIKYPYKLLKGISHQHVALDILQEQGFDGSLVNQAQKLVDTMVTQSLNIGL